MLVISASSDFDYGSRLGRDHGRLYRRLLYFTRPLDKEPLRRRKAALAEYYPQALERMEGLARAAGLERERVISAGPGNPLPVSGCTNFAAVPPATRDGQVYLSWNLDLPRHWRLLMGRFPFYVRKIKGYHPYLCLDHSFMGLPLAFGFGVINSQGLCSIYNAVGVTDGGEGLTFFELNNMMMEGHADVESAAEVMKGNPRHVVPGESAAILMNANLLLSDARGDATLVEYSHSHIEVTSVSEHEGLLASANHHQFIDRDKTGSADPTSQPLIAGSYARLARMWELLRLYHGSIDPITAQTITADHGLNYDYLKEFGIERAWYEERIEDSTICAHPWNFWRHLLRGELEDAYAENLISCTIYGILLEPRRCTLWFHPGHPCRKRYRPFWLGDLLEMPHATEARGELEYQPDPDMSLKTREDRGWIFTRPISDSGLARKARDILLAYVLWQEHQVAKYEARTRERESD